MLFVNTPVKLPVFYCLLPAFQCYFNAGSRHAGTIPVFQGFGGIQNSHTNNTTLHPRVASPGECG